MASRVLGMAEIGVPPPCIAVLSEAGVQAASLDSGAIFAWYRSGPGAPAHAVTIIQAALRLRMLRPVVVPSPGAPVAPALPPCRVPPRPG